MSTRVVSQHALREELNDVGCPELAGPAVFAGQSDSQSLPQCDQPTAAAGILHVDCSCKP